MAWRYATINESGDSKHSLPETVVQARKQGNLSFLFLRDSYQDLNLRKPFPIAILIPMPNVWDIHAIVRIEEIRGSTMRTLQK